MKAAVGCWPFLINLDLFLSIDLSVNLNVAIDYDVLNHKKRAASGRPFSLNIVFGLLPERGVVLAILKHLA